MISSYVIEKIKLEGYNMYNDTLLVLAYVAMFVSLGLIALGYKIAKNVKNNFAREELRFSAEILFVASFVLVIAMILANVFITQNIGNINKEISSHMQDIPEEP
jgi:uncharacterized membrane protein